MMKCQYCNQENKKGILILQSFICKKCIEQNKHLYKQSINVTISRMITYIASCYSLFITSKSTYEFLLIKNYILATVCFLMFLLMGTTIFFFSNNNYEFKKYSVASKLVCKLLREKQKEWE